MILSSSHPLVVIGRRFLCERPRFGFAVAAISKAATVLASNGTPSTPMQQKRAVLLMLAETVGADFGTQAPLYYLRREVDASPFEAETATEVAHRAALEDDITKSRAKRIKAFAGFTAKQRRAYR